MTGKSPAFQSYDFVRAAQTAERERLRRRLLALAWFVFGVLCGLGLSYALPLLEALT